MKIDEFRQRRKLKRAGAARAIRKVQKVRYCTENGEKINLQN